MYDISIFMLIKNATIVNEKKVFRGSVLIEGERIAKIFHADESIDEKYLHQDVIDATGSYLIPGVIDEHVHFREPGLTHKGDIFTESRAAVAGGTTSYLEMPNTNPATTTLPLLEEKFHLAEEKSLANFSFYLGATNDNIEEIKKLSSHKNVCGVKVFMGSSTGNMLVDKTTSLERIFAETPCLIAAHCEDENIIRQKTLSFKEKYAQLGSHAPANIHHLIRTEEACYRSTIQAIELATRFNTRLHVTHISTQKELELFASEASKSLADKRITAETCVNYLLFDDYDYDKYGLQIKCNPAIKTLHDRICLLDGVKNDVIDTIATDHAPHAKSEKFVDNYFKCPSGVPSIQHSLIAMLQLCNDGLLDIETVVEKMSHNPAIIYHIKERGFIREGYFADLVIIDPHKTQIVTPDNIYYKCGWSPLEGETFQNSVTHTFVNGNLIFENGRFNESFRGKALEIDNK